MEKSKEKSLEERYAGIEEHLKETFGCDIYVTDYKYPSGYISRSFALIKANRRLEISRVIGDDSMYVFAGMGALTEKQIKIILEVL